jgi:hypothetical protein
MTQMALRFVVLGDMVESRRRSNRAKLADRVRDVLKQLGNDFAAYLQAPPMATRGLDEFSAVFKDPSGAFDLQVRLNLFLWPSRFRMAAVWGEVDVAPDATDAALMDGPAFHDAAARLRSMKRDGRMFAIEGKTIDRSTSSLATALGSAHQAMTASLKARTIETLRVLYDRPPGEDPPTQEEIARSMALKSRQAVSDALRRANFDTLRDIEDALRGWLRSLT